MHLIYLIAAAVGCTVLAVQVVLQLIGLGGDEVGDFDHAGDVDHAGDLAHADAGESNIFFGVLSFKTLTAFVAFFGLAGLASQEMGINNAALTVFISMIAGLCAGAVVVVLMRLLVGLQSSGTVRLDDAVGLTAKVYLRVPGNMKGQGKITVQLGGRDLELSAVTPGEEIPTGAVVEVTRKLEGETFEIIAV
jgi:hypothetical protein